MSILEETRWVVGDSPSSPCKLLLLFPPVVSRFFVLPYSLYQLVVDRPSSSPLASNRQEGHDEERTWRVLPRKRKTRRTRVCPRRASAHRGSLVPRHRGLPFTLHLFYFIFRGINVFGALPVG